MLNNFRCQIKDHCLYKIEEVCINQNCQQVSRRVCIKCLKEQLHNKDPNYQITDIADEEHLEQIITTFQSSLADKFQEIELQYLIQLRIQIDEIQFRLYRLMETQNMIQELRKQQQLINQPSLQDYLEILHSHNLSIYQYLNNYKKAIIQFEKNKNKQISYLIKSDIGIQQYSIQQKQPQEDEQNIHIFDFINDMNKRCPEIDSQIKQINKIPMYTEVLDLHSQSRILIDLGLNQKDEELKRLMLTQTNIMINKRNIHNHNALLFQKVEQKQIDYNFLEYLFAQGVKALDNQLFTDALSMFDEILKINPNHKNAILNKGITLQNLGNLYDAVANYNLLIKLDRQSLNAYYNKEAFQTFEQILQLDTNNTDALTKKGEILYHLKKYQESLSVFGSILTNYPNLVNVINNKGVVLRSLKKYDEAIITFDKALVLNPRYISALNNKAITWYYQGKIYNAEQLFKQVLLYDANNKIANQGLNKLQEIAGQSLNMSNQQRVRLI